MYSKSVFFIEIYMAHKFLIFYNLRYNLEYFEIFFIFILRKYYPVKTHKLNEIIFLLYFLK